MQEQREQALSYIEDYLKDEFEITEPDFSDLTQIDLGYTTTEDEQHTIQIHADLEHCTISKFVDDTLYAQDRPNPGVDFFRFKKLSTKSINKNNLLKNNDFKKTVIL